MNVNFRTKGLLGKKFKVNIRGLRRKFKLGDKIMAGFFLLLIFMGLIASFGILGMNKTVKEYEQLLNINVQTRINVLLINSLVNQQVADIRGYLHYKDKSMMESYNNINQELAKLFQEINPLLTTEKSQKFFVDIINAQNQFVLATNEVLTQFDSGDKELAIYRSEEKMQPKIQEVKQISNDWIKWIDEENANKRNELKKAIQYNKNMMYLVILSAIAFSSIVVFSITRSVSKPIVSLTEIAKNVARGDLTKPVPKFFTGDEVQDLADAFSTMTANLYDLIIKINEAAIKLISSSQEFIASVEETTSATEQTANTIHQLSMGATNQAEEIQKTNVAVSQMSDSIQQIAESSAAVSLASSKMSEVANQGVHESSNAVAKIKHVCEVSNKTSEVVKTLGLESERIEQIVSVIKTIADQTNLLALNAAIEAARAGEHGRGFAVVAEEVRKLAEQSSNSAEQIAELVKGIQLKVNQAIKAMDLSNQEVEEGAKAVNRAEESFTIIVNEINNVAEQMYGVNAFIQQIVSGSNMVVKSMENIATVAQQTAASSQEVAATAEEQFSSLEEIANSAQGLAQLAEELKEKISRFAV